MVAVSSGAVGRKAKSERGCCNGGLQSERGRIEGLALVHGSVLTMYDANPEGEPLLLRDVHVLAVRTTAEISART